LLHRRFDLTGSAGDFVGWRQPAHAPAPGSRAASDKQYGIVQQFDNKIGRSAVGLTQPTLLAGSSPAQLR
jgi:hypothetical protein